MLNTIERKLHELLKKNPHLKNRVKYAYQKLWAFFSSKESWVPDGCVFLENAFFGFHDKSPWSNGDSSLIAHRHSGVGNELCSKIGSVDIVEYYFDGTLPRKIASTSAFNWQQGSQLQWVRSMNNTVVFNDFVSSKLVARQVNLDTGQEILLDGGVAALSKDGRTRATFCFDTFGKAMPGYGYDYSTNSATSTIQPGVLRIYCNGNDIERDILVSDLVELFPFILEELGTDDPATCFFSHALFSPNDMKLAVMLRCQQEGRELRSKLIQYDCINGEISLFPFTDMVSHFCWFNDDRVFAFARGKDGDRFYVSGISSDSISLVNELKHLPDGHPHMSDNGVIVFDTYPNRKRQQRLYVAQMRGDKLDAKMVASLYAPMTFLDAQRVDLHPRVNSNGSWIAVDCSYSGTRSMLLIPIDSN